MSVPISSRIYHRLNSTTGFLVLMILLVTGERKTNAQVYRSLEDTTAYFKARVLDSLTRKPVVFAHIINTNRGKATISDTLGYFYIRTSPGDRLQITAIGFAARSLKIGYRILRSRVIHDVLLEPIRYSIDAVRINPLGSYEQFRKRFVSIRVPGPDREINPAVLDDIEQGTDTLDMLITPRLSPVTALYNLLSKEGKSKRKLRQLIEKEAFEKQIAHKYSPDIVSSIAGYTGFRLYEFMEFCSFKKDFLLDASQYEITRAILARKEAFEAARKK